MKNLVVLHLESISRQRFSAFGHAFPFLSKLFSEALVFDNYFSSATSTLMAVSYLAHGNDFEFDAEPRFEGMRPAGNMPHLFSVLRDRGYRVATLCLNAFEGQRPHEFNSWPTDLPPVVETRHIPALHESFECLTDARPFALNVWNLITHVEQSMALAPYADGLTDQLEQSCILADESIRQLVTVLAGKGLLANTTIVIYGDHGDDFWTHGFKSGMLHGVEPSTALIWSPLAIVDPSLTAGRHAGIASTIDLRATCLALLGIADDAVFAPAGIDLLAGTNEFAYAQNFTATQPDNPRLGISRAFSVTDGAYSLLASARGLELYAYRLDPGNSCNLLHFFEPSDGGLRFVDRPGSAGHFRRALADNRGSLSHIERRFVRLRDALERRLTAKREYALHQGAHPGAVFDPRCVDRFNRTGRDTFFGNAAPRSSTPIYDISFRAR